MPSHLMQGVFLENLNGLHRQVVQQNMTVLGKNRIQDLVALPNIMNCEIKIVSNEWM